MQGSAKRLWPGLVNFVPAAADHFCLSLLAAFTQPGRSLLATPVGELHFISTYILTHLNDPLQEAIGEDALVVRGREDLHDGARQVVVEHAVRPLRPRLQRLPDGQRAEADGRENTVV